MTSSAFAERVREVLDYNPDTGIFTWKVNISNLKAGRVTGCPTGPGGHLAIRVSKTLYLAHRLAFLIMTGEWPRGEVDHINGCGSDNRWGNLRDGDRHQNMQNRRGPRKGSKSGILGATWDARYGKWVARIHVDGRSKHLGYFSTPEEAGAVYLDAKRVLHGGCTI